MQSKMRMNYYVYFLTNKNNRVLYVGVTNNLVRRIYERKNHLDAKSFTTKYKATKLVYYEQTTDVRIAIEREKQFKSWNRERKKKLIESMSPNWEDLYSSMID